MRIFFLSKPKNHGDSFTFSGGSFTGPINLPATDPVELNEAVARRYVDTVTSTLNASNLISGTIAMTTVPGFTGDFQNEPGNIFFTLKPSGVVEGTYCKVTVDEKGRVLSGGALEEADIPSFNWSKIGYDKPTTLQGYKIQDAVNSSGDTMTGYLSLANNPSTAYHLATKYYTDTALQRVGSVRTGDLIFRPSAVIPDGYLRCDGSNVPIATYPYLYNVIGGAFNDINTPTGMFKLPNTSTTDPANIYSFIKT